MLVGRTIFRCTFHNWYSLRNLLLRLFGASIGQGVRIRPTVRIEIPWHLTAENGVVVGDFAILYNLGPITLGERCVISQYAHLCAGTHDHESTDFKLICPPITIGREAWIATDVYIAPDVTVGARSVVGARSNVYKDLPEGMICIGSPARPVKPRTIRSEADSQH